MREMIGVLIVGAVWGAIGPPSRRSGDIAEGWWAPAERLVAAMHEAGPDALFKLSDRPAEALEAAYVSGRRGDPTA